MDIIRGLRESGFWLVKLILVVLWSDGMRFSSNALSKFLFIELLPHSLQLHQFAVIPCGLWKLTCTIYHHTNPNLKSKFQNTNSKIGFPNSKSQILRCKFHQSTGLCPCVEARLPKWWLGGGGRPTVAIRSPHHYNPEPGFLCEMLDFLMASFEFRGDF